MYVVWSDSESRKEVYNEFWDYDEAYDFASEFVHQFDGEEFRVIAHIEDTEKDDTIDTVENIDKKSAAYPEYLRSLARDLQ